MSIELVMLSSHLILCRPLPLLPSIFPSIRVFSNESAFASGGQSIGVSAFIISPSNEHPGLIFFRMDWLDLLAVQGTLKSLLQHHSSKASVLWRSAFFTVQLSRPYMTTGKTIALTRLWDRLPQNRMTGSQGKSICNFAGYGQVSIHSGHIIYMYQPEAYGRCI